MNRRALAAAAAFLIAGALPARAQTPAAEGAFRLGGVELSFPLPGGYCLPQGQYADIAQMIAAADNFNVTDLTAYQCEGNTVSLDYPILIKTPKGDLRVQIDRPTMLGQMGAEFDKPEALAMLLDGKIDAENNKSLAAVFGSEIATKTDVKPVGHDDTCAYMAGTIAIAATDKIINSSVASCITAVKQRVVIIYVFGPAKGPASVAALVPRVKSLAQAFIARNEGA